MANKGNVKTLAFGIKVNAKDFEKKMKKLKKSLAKFGESVAKIGKGVAAMGAGIGAGLAASAKAFADYGDEIAKTARKSGIGVKELTALQFAAERSGASLPQLINGLRKMQVNLVQAAKGGGVAKRELEDLGLSAENLMKLSPEQQFIKIGDAIGELKHPTEQGAAAMALFGKQGAELLPLFQEGAGGIDALMKKAEELGLTMDAVDATNAEKLTDALSDLGSQIKAVFFKIGAQVAKSGLIDTLIKISENILPPIFEYVEKIGNRFREVAQVEGGYLLASFQSLWDGAKIFFDNMFSALGSLGINIGNTAEDTVANFGTAFHEIGKFFATFRERAALGFIKLGDFIVRALTLPVQLAGNAMYAFLNQLSKIGGDIGKYASKAADGMNNLLNMAEDPVSSIFKEEVEGLKYGIQEINDEMDKRFIARQQKIQGIINKSIDDAKKADDNLKGTSANKSGGFWGALADMGKNIIGKVKEFSQDIQLEQASIDIQKIGPSAIAGSVEALRLQFGGEDKVQIDQLKALKGIEKNTKMQTYRLT